MQKTLNRDEKMILILIAHGYTAVEICSLLADLTPWCLRYIEKNFIEKLGARNQAHAVYLAFAKKHIPL